MATRSRIGYVAEDGKVHSIYCHWDGYPSNNGEILLKHYTDMEKVTALVALGSISILGEEVEPKPEGDGVKKHTFDEPQEGVTVAYCRDRGEDFKDVKPRIDESVDAFVKSDVEEWGYLFLPDGKWLVVNGWDERRTAKTLTQELIEKLG
jgi:hypothetical protein